MFPEKWNNMYTDKHSSLKQVKVSASRRRTRRTRTRTRRRRRRRRRRGRERKKEEGKEEKEKKKKKKKKNVWIWSLFTIISSKHLHLFIREADKNVLIEQIKQMTRGYQTPTLWEKFCPNQERILSYPGSSLTAIHWLVWPDLSVTRPHHAHYKESKPNFVCSK